MPSVRPQRQPGAALAWYGSAAGQALLGSEQAAIAQLILGCTGARWAWLGVPGAAPPAVPTGAVARQALTLRRDGAGFEGSVRCAAALPFASEALSAVFIQHALDDGWQAAALLAECERVLVPGGRLWLAVLNPWSPYRARWASPGLRARDPGRWQTRLRRAGFATDSVGVQWFGPQWRPSREGAGVGALDRLRAGVALTVEKRARALIPPARLNVLRLQPGVRRVTTARYEAHDRDGGELP